MTEGIYRVHHEAVNAFIGKIESDGLALRYVDSV
jgi:hypothetical protein